MNPRISNWLNYRELGHQVITIDPKSETVPDMTMSLEELLLRHTQGREVPEFPGYYDDEELDEFWPDVSRLDLVEIQEIQEATLDHIAKLQYKLHNDFKSQNEVDPKGNPKEGAQRTSDPKQQTTEGRQEPAEGGKPQPSEGQQH